MELLKFIVQMIKKIKSVLDNSKDDICLFVTRLCMCRRTLTNVCVGVRERV